MTEEHALELARKIISMVEQAPMEIHAESLSVQSSTAGYQSPCTCSVRFPLAGQASYYLQEKRIEGFLPEEWLFSITRDDLSRLQYLLFENLKQCIPQAEFFKEVVTSPLSLAALIWHNVWDQAAIGDLRISLKLKRGEREYPISDTVRLQTILSPANLEELQQVLIPMLAEDTTQEEAETASPSTPTERKRTEMDFFLP